MTDWRTHYFPASSDPVVTHQLAADQFMACRRDKYGNTIFGYGATRPEAVADLAEHTRILIAPRAPILLSVVAAISNLTNRLKGAR